MENDVAPKSMPWDELIRIPWKGAESDGVPTPGIVVEPNWRTRVADLPHDRWVAWRRRVTEILSALNRFPTAAEVKAADRKAAEEFGIAPRS